MIPRGLVEAKKQRRLSNTGRLIVQYMAELNVRLENVDAYMAAQVPRYTFYSADTNGKRRAIPPWDSLGIISNEVMAEMNDTVPYEGAEALASRYIAQQVLSMAASQVRTEGQRVQDADPADAILPVSISVGAVSFQSTRLDPHDLKTSLLGPYAIAFATAS